MIKWLFILGIIFPSLGQNIDNEHELLWEISGNGLKRKSYLFGSLHSNDKRLFNLTDSTYFALNASEIIVLETDVFYLFENWDTRQGKINFHYDNVGNPYTSTNASTKTLYGDEDGMPQFLDAYFLQYCYNAGKEFAYLEPIDFQLDMLTDLPAPKFKNIRLESLLTTKESMIEMYVQGDIYGLSEMLKINLAVYPGLYKEMIIERNHAMVNKLDSLVKMDAVFCAVGAGHLAGSGGMINLLRSKGYKVRKVKATYSDHPISEKVLVKRMNYYNYTNDSLNLHVRFPGKPTETESEFDNAIIKLIYRDLGQGNTYSVEVFEREAESEIDEISNQFIASPTESPKNKITLDNGDIAFQGLSDSYPDGLYWTRVIVGENFFAVIKTYGGNKFMNSNRPKNFFDNVWFD